jgi:nucleotide-binding universal stress UspA family protein
MTDTSHKASIFRNAQQVAGVRSGKRLRLLAVVDGTECTNRIVDFIIAFSEGRAGTEVVILNVQSKRTDARLRGYQSFKQDEIDDRLINELAMPIVNSVSARLQKVGIICLSKAEIGDPVLTILRCAAENACDLILVGEHSPKGMLGWIPSSIRLWLGSRLALRLIAVSPVSVVVVK